MAKAETSWEGCLCFSRESGSVFVGDMATTVPLFVPSEGGRRGGRSGMIARMRHSALVAMVRIKAIVHGAMKVGWTVEPGADPDEGTACEPLRPIVAVRGAGVRWIVKVAIGTNRGYTDIDADLRLNLGAAAAKQRPPIRDNARS